LATVICARPASRYEREIPGALKADVIVSQNSFEHFLDAGGILGQIRSALAPDGRLFITFAPPLYAPWGAHIAFYCRLPWVRLLFPESTVMEVRALFRPDNVRT
jgi:SAM-dependent methyltransferase